MKKRVYDIENRVAPLAWDMSDQPVVRVTIDPVLWSGSTAIFQLGR
jgi:hypothetical protein